MDNLCTILKNIEGQFHIDTLNSDTPWKEENNQRFWRDFEGISAILRHEVNKLALVVNVNETKGQKPDEKDIQSLIESVEKACVTLWSTFLTVSLQSGTTFCEEIANIGQTLVRSTHDLVKKLQTCRSRQEALQSVGEIWEKCDRLKLNLSKNNVQAVCQSIQAQRNLVQDAIQELEDTKNLQSEDSAGSDMAMDEDEFETKWSDAEMAVLAPSLGLLKTSQALLKKIYFSLKEKGKPFDGADKVKEMDDTLAQCIKISPLVDDFALSLYPTLVATDVEKHSQALIQHSRFMLELLKSVHFVSPQDHEQWCNFLIKALDHNHSKLEVALTQLKLSEVEIK